MTPNDATEFDIDEATGCSHAPCVCVAGANGFCSAHCEAAVDADGDDAACGCGHADCETAAAATA